MLKDRFLNEKKIRLYAITILMLGFTIIVPSCDAQVGVPFPLFSFHAIGGDTISSLLFTFSLSTFVLAIVANSLFAYGFLSLFDALTLLFESKTDFMRRALYYTIFVLLLISAIILCIDLLTFIPILKDAMIPVHTFTWLIIYALSMPLYPLMGGSLDIDSVSDGAGLMLFIYFFILIYLLACLVLHLNKRIQKN